MWRERSRWLSALTLGISLAGIGAWAIYSAALRSASIELPPKPTDDDAWHWAAATPGANVYFAAGRRRVDGAIVSVWIDRRSDRSEAAIAQDLFELEQFDCSRRRTRLLSVIRQFRDTGGRERQRIERLHSEWLETGSRTVQAKLLDAACAGGR